MATVRVDFESRDNTAAAFQSLNQRLSQFNQRLQQVSNNDLSRLSGLNNNELRQVNAALRQVENRLRAAGTNARRFGDALRGSGSNLDASLQQALNRVITMGSRLEGSGRRFNRDVEVATRRLTSIRPVLSQGFRAIGGGGGGADLTGLGVAVGSAIGSAFGDTVRSRFRNIARTFSDTVYNRLSVPLGNAVSSAIQPALEFTRRGFRPLPTGGSGLRISSVSENIERDNRQMENTQRIARAVSVSVAGLIFALAGAAAAYGVLALASIRAQDNFVRFRSQLRLVSDGVQDTENNLMDLATIAIDTRTPLETTIRLYTRMARAIRSANVELRGVSIQDITRGILQTTAISGSTAQEASAAIVQFSQAIASNRFSGDELRSVSEQLPALRDFIAEGLGLTIGQLRERGQAGYLTAQRVLDGVINRLQEINQEFGKIEVSIGQAAERVATAFQIYANSNPLLQPSVVRALETLERVLIVAARLQGIDLGPRNEFDLLNRDIELTERNLANLRAELAAVDADAFAGPADIFRIENLIRLAEERLASLREDRQAPRFADFVVSEEATEAARNQTRGEKALDSAISAVAKRIGEKRSEEELLLGIELRRAEVTRLLTALENAPMAGPFLVDQTELDILQRTPAILDELEEGIKGIGDEAETAAERMERLLQAAGATNQVEARARRAFRERGAITPLLNYLTERDDLDEDDRRTTRDILIAERAGIDAEDIRRQNESFKSLIRTRREGVEIARLQLAADRDQDAVTRQRVITAQILSQVQGDIRPAQRAQARAVAQEIDEQNQLRVAFEQRNLSAREIRDINELNLRQAKEQVRVEQDYNNLLFERNEISRREYIENQRQIDAQITGRVYESTREAFERALIDGLRQGAQSSEWTVILGQILIATIATAFSNASAGSFGTSRLGGFFERLFTPPGRARGGPVGGGQAYVVGERGREIFVPGANGYVYPIGAGGAGGAGAFNQTNNIIFQGQDFRQDIRRNLISSGGLIQDLARPRRRRM